LSCRRLATFCRPWGGRHFSILYYFTSHCCAFVGQWTLLNIILCMYILRRDEITHKQLNVNAPAKIVIIIIIEYNNSNRNKRTYILHVPTKIEWMSEGGVAYRDGCVYIYYYNNIVVLHQQQNRTRKTLFVYFNLEIPFARRS